MHVFGDRSEIHIVLNVSDAGVCAGNSFGFSKGAVFARDLGPVNVICLEDEEKGLLSKASIILFKIENQFYVT